MNKKFTLMELITAIVVISILAAIILLNISKVKDRALDTAKIANLSEMQKIVDMYYLERDMYPTIVQPKLGPEKVEQSMLVTDFQKKKIKHEFCVQPTGEVIFFDDCESVSLDDLPLPVEVLTCEEALQDGYEKCIQNQEDLKSIQEGLYSRYIIVNDFNITGEWAPIVLQNINTAVELNGNGYTISDLLINTTANKSGMFSESNDITIKNLKLTNAKMNINNHENSGLLVGYTNGTVVLDNISVNSEITGAGDYVGSLIGNLDNIDEKNIISNITNIVGSIKIELTSGNYVGGLFGVNVGEIDSVNLEVDIRGSGDNYGGIAGYQVTYADIDNKSSNINVTGKIENNGNVTGLVFGGLFNGSGHTNISAKGTVIGKSTTGGLFGRVFSKLKDISFEGDVIGTNDVGGISGEGGYEKINDASNNINVKGKIYGTGNQVGGVSGALRMGDPKGFNVDVVVNGDGQYVGGLFGMLNTTATDIVGKVVVTGNAGVVGGVVGNNTSGLDNVHIEGQVNGANSHIGGISGRSSGSLTNIHYDGIVKSLNSENSIYENLGGLIGYSTAEINNASFKGSISANETKVGGITGYNVSSITDASVQASIESTNGHLGGISGMSNNPIENATFEGNVKSTFGDNVGGLAGISNSSATNITISGEVSSVGDFTGGAAGKSTNPMNNVNFNGKISSIGDYTGGLVGQNYGLTHNVSFNGDIISKGNYVGGISGAYGGSSVDLLRVTGTIQAEGDYVGGMFGETPFGPNNGYVIATITNTGDYTGGIIGNMQYNSIGKVYFSGAITGGNNVDPIIANISNENLESIKNNPNSILYWNSDLYTGSSIGLGSGKTDVELKDISTFTGWDFNNTWMMDDYLKFK